MGRITVNDREFQKMLDNLEELPEQSMKKVYPYYKSETPVRSGNARNQTKLKGQTINSDYAYAGRLDEGWSKQAPKGFTEHTIDFMERFIGKQVGKI